MSTASTRWKCCSPAISCPPITRFRIGLVNQVVPAGQERDAALALARKIAAKPPRVVKIGKQAFYRQLELGLADAYQLTADVMVENMLFKDAEEGIAAFIDKRPPVWDDR